MGKIDLDLSFYGLLKYARTALDKGDTVTCILNLNEALEKADDRKQKQQVYETFVECYGRSSSNTAILSAVVKEVKSRVEDDYYRFDFARKKAYLDEENDGPNYISARITNDVKNLIRERKYDDAMRLLMDTTPSLDECEELVDVLNEAVDLDKKLNLDAYILTLLAIMAVLPTKVDILRLMLEGGHVTRRMMVDGVDFLLDDEDSNALCLMGITFFENNEIKIAERFLEKALKLDPIDEDALYYMALIKRINGENDGVDYWSKYKQLYKVTEPPIALTERFFQSEYLAKPMPYRSLPRKFLENILKELLALSGDKGDITEETASLLSDFMKVAPEEISVNLPELFKINKNKPLLIETYIKLLASARIPDATKLKIYSELIDFGYEGEITLITEERVLCFRIAKLHKRVSRILGLAYKRFLEMAVECKFYLPINCGHLAYIVKKLDEIIFPEFEDLEFCLVILAINYLKRLNINTDLIGVLKELDLDITCIQEGVDKFDLNDIFI